MASRNAAWPRAVERDGDERADRGHGAGRDQRREAAQDPALVQATDALGDARRRHVGLDGEVGPGRTTIDGEAPKEPQIDGIDFISKRNRHI
jgi:hypothetical protein